jgi:hypothetical protein
MFRLSSSSILKNRRQPKDKQKMKKLLLAVALLSLLPPLIAFTYTEIPFRGCSHYQPSQKSEFLQIIDELSEEKKKEYLLKHNLVGGYTWKDFEFSPYDFTNREDIARIYDQQDTYICDAAYIVSSKNYDQSQKAYAILLMQHTSIREYLYLAKIVNQSYSQNILTDKEALINLFYSPDLHGTGTNAQYRWLPAWRREFGKHAEKMLTKEQLDTVYERLFFNQW